MAIKVEADVLVACEYSGVVRDAFSRYGLRAASCDLKPDQNGAPGVLHYQCDVRDLDLTDVALLVGHPPCTYLANVDGRHFKRDPLREAHRNEAIAFVKWLWAQPVPLCVIANPVGALGRMWQKPSQTIQPWFFGGPWKKSTCLWIRGLPTLRPTNVVSPTMGAWVNQFDNLGNEAADPCGITFPSVAEAMASQWSARVIETIGARVLADSPIRWP